MPTSTGVTIDSNFSHALVGHLDSGIRRNDDFATNHFLIPCRVNQFARIFSCL